MTLIQRSLIFAALLASSHLHAEHYLLAYFKGNGEDGLHLASSGDGYRWRALKDDQSFLKPEVGGKLMRDPSISRGPDGFFHMVWTSSWNEKGIGIAHSKDLIHWTEQAFIPVMKHEPTAKNCWAPEILWDPEEKSYLIYWSTTLPGKFKKGEKSGEQSYNHRIYATRTVDFKSYSKTQLFYDPGFNVIDPVIRRVKNQWLMILKDETRYPKAEKNLRVATATQLKGPWKTSKSAFSPNWVEGPMPLAIGEQWLIYYDMYRAHRFGAMITSDFKHWQDVSDQIQLPKGVRHGCLFKVDAVTMKRLENIKTTP